MGGYHEHRYYAAEFDAEAVRVSMADSNGAEYFAIVAAGHGPKFLERRHKALEAIQNAMTRQWVAGCVGIFT